MQGVVELLKDWQLHPVVDHFTVSLIFVGVLIDLVASLAPSRPWLRSMATTLIVLGALAAVASKFTGGWEAHRVWQELTVPVQDRLKWHAKVGDFLMWAFAGLAVWRLGLQFIGFLSRTRIIYLLVAIAAAGAILYQADLGGDLVYDYGVGTALMNTQAPSPAASITAPEAPAPIPTVYVPPPTPAAVPSSAAPVASAAPAPAPSIAAPAPSPATTPAASVGTEVSPPPGAAPPSAAGSPASKSTTL
ncbi:MAG: DUF2231 domain-containing protein [Candidatus Binataceae bacterium]